MVHSPMSIVFLLAGLAAVALFAGCDLLNMLIGSDTTPPTCQISSPADSSLVNGLVSIAATATDSIGVERVEFYADGTLVGTDSSVPYAGSWDASGQAERTWHTLSCIAYDAAQNKGYSDTVAVEIVGVGQTSVYHGELDVAARSREAVQFDAEAGDTLAGDAQVASGSALSSFMWLDNANFQKFVAGQAYTALFQRDNFAQMSMRQAVPAAGGYYIVFVNAGNAIVKCWARFVLE